MSTPNVFAMRNRQTHRAPINPLDKSTIFSILPKEIHEEKCTIQPGVFDIPPGSYDRPSILIVGPSSWWREIDPEQPLLEITNSSIQVADSVVRDYSNGLIACNMADIMPGLFYLPGEWTADKLRKEQKPLLDKAKAGQDRWFHELIKMADILWARSNGNPLSISFDARLACKELNISNKPWLGDAQSMELIRCVACGNLRNPQYPICPHCKAVVDPARAKELQLTFVQ
jgi:hypothetical protein